VMTASTDESTVGLHATPIRHVATRLICRKYSFAKPDTNIADLLDSLNLDSLLLVSRNTVLSTWVGCLQILFDCAHPHP
jgi:hypothetical protein